MTIPQKSIRIRTNDIRAIHIKASYFLTNRMVARLDILNITTHAIKKYRQSYLTKHTDGK